MSEAEKKEEGAPKDAPPKKSRDIFTLVALLNTLAVMATAGVVVYTKFIYKRPKITEYQERAKLDQMKEKKGPDAKSTTTAMVAFDPVTVNIRSTSGQVRTTEAGTIEGKLHYATIGFALEIKDSRQTQLIEELKPMFMDKIMSLLGRKTYSELTTVQGRFLVRSQIMDAVNDLILHDQAERAAARAAKKKKEAAEKGDKEAESKSKAAQPEDEGDRTTETRDVLVTNVYFTQFVVQ